MRSDRLFNWLLIVCLVGAPLLLAEGEDAEEPTNNLQWTTLSVTPSSPSVDQLCRLAVGIKNLGEHDLSRFAFTVDIDGQDQTVYRNRLFLQRVASGQSLDLRLLNFWSTEPSRPRSDAGKIELRITLQEARWVANDGQNEQDLGPVEGLPITRTLTVELR